MVVDDDSLIGFDEAECSIIQVRILKFSLAAVSPFSVLVRSSSSSIVVALSSNFRGLLLRP